MASRHYKAANLCRDLSMCWKHGRLVVKEPGTFVSYAVMYTSNVRMISTRAQHTVMEARHRKKLVRMTTQGKLPGSP